MEISYQRHFPIFGRRQLFLWFDVQSQSVSGEAAVKIGREALA
jgi:hypothetical protein